MTLTDKLKTGLKIGALGALGFLAFKCSDDKPEITYNQPIVETMTKVKKIETPLRVPIIKSIRKAGYTSFNFLHCSNVDSFGYVFEGNKINTIDGSIYNELILMEKEEEGPEYMIRFWDAGPDGIVDKMEVHRMNSTDLDTTDMLNFDFRTLKKFPILFPGYEKAEWATLPNRKGISYNRDHATKDYAKVIEAIFK